MIGKRILRVYEEVRKLANTGIVPDDKQCFDRVRSPGKDVQKHLGVRIIE